MLSSYPKVYNIGHRAIADLLNDPVIIEEKIDGSQFSAGLINGKLEMRSHHCEVFPENAGMFQKIVDYFVSIKDLLHPEWTYRGEFLSKPKHNTLEYSRVPKNFFILFDINDGQESYLPPDQKILEAFPLGFETVPLLSHHTETMPLDFSKLLQTKSVLGGTTIEGFVIKNYNRYGIDGHCLMGKYVSEAFKEKHQKNLNFNKKGFIELLTAEYKTEARWNKAVQHLREQGLLSDEPKDIGILLKEINEDLMNECGDELKEKLFNYWFREIKRGIAKGFPEWYKQELLKKQLENKPAGSTMWEHLH